MTKSLSNNIMLVLAFLGCALALLLTVEHYKPIDIGCTKTGAGCGKTLNSDYGHLGPIPTAAFGLSMYVGIVGLCVLRRKALVADREREEARAAAYATAASPNEAPSFPNDDILPSDSLKGNAYVAPPVPLASGSLSVRQLDMLLWGISLAGFGISLFLQYTAIYQLRSFCPYCFSSAVLVTLIFALASRDYLLDGRPLTGEHKMLAGVLGLIVVLGGFIAVPDILAIINTTPKYDPGPNDITKDASHKEASREVMMPSDLHFKGDPNATHTLIEFADYQCPHCAQTSPKVDEVLKHFPKDMRLAFREFPLPIASHKWSRKAAQAAEAAALQGKFWEMHDLLFKSQKEMESVDFKEEQIVGMAKQLGLDTKRFQQDWNSDAIDKRVQRDLDAGTAGGLQSTPTFFFVSPNHITRFAGLEELEKFMSNPNDPLWK